MLNFSNH